MAWLDAGAHSTPSRQAARCRSVGSSITRADTMTLFGSYGSHSAPTPTMCTCWYLGFACSRYQSTTRPSGPSSGLRRCGPQPGGARHPGEGIWTCREARGGGPHPGRVDTARARRLYTACRVHKRIHRHGRFRSLRCRARARLRGTLEHHPIPEDAPPLRSDSERSTVHRAVTARGTALNRCNFVLGRSMCQVAWPDGVPCGRPPRQPGVSVNTYQKARRSNLMARGPAADSSRTAPENRVAAATLTRFHRAMLLPSSVSLTSSESSECRAILNRTSVIPEHH